MMDVEDKDNMFIVLAVELATNQPKPKSRWRFGL